MRYPGELQPVAAVAGSQPWRRILNSSHNSLQISFRHILYATDFSPAAERALPYAVEIARRSLATIHAVHVTSPDVYPEVPPAEWPEMASRERELRARKKGQLELELQELPHEILFLTGDILEEIEAIVREKGIDLLVLGTHGRTGISKALMGSVAEKLFRRVPCPVLAVGPGVTSRRSHAAAAELNRILYATDFSADSLAAARYAISLAKDHRAELVLLHTAEPGAGEDDRLSLDTLKNVVPLGARLQSKPVCLIEHGAPADTILKTAEDAQADLIVLGTHEIGKHLTAATRLSASIDAKVAAAANCPVLIVHA